MYPVEATGQLFADTVKNIQRDVLKIALLAAASIAYRTLKGLVRHSLPPALLAAPAIGILIAVVGLGSLALLSRVPVKSDLGSSVTAQDPAVDRPVGTLDYVRSHPLSIGAIIFAVYAIDRADLLVGLQRHVDHWFDLVAPRFRALFFLGAGRERSAAHSSGWKALGRWLASSALLVQALRTLVAVRAARALAEAQRLAWSQQHPARRVWRWLLATQPAWQPKAESLVRVLASVLGTGSAVKYLMARGGR